MADTHDRPRKPSSVPSARGHTVLPDGRKIGHMWPEDFEAHCSAIFGKHWVGKFARYAGLSRVMVGLYRTGRSPIPRQIAVLVMLLWQTKSGLKPDAPLPDIDPPTWLHQ